MINRTVTAVLDAPKEEVFDYLSQLHNLPDWATDFARELKYVDGKAKSAAVDYRDAESRRSLSVDNTATTRTGTARFNGFNGIVVGFDRRTGYARQRDIGGRTG